MERGSCEQKARNGVSAYTLALIAKRKSPELSTLTERLYSDRLIHLRVHGWVTNTDMEGKQMRQAWCTGVALWGGASAGRGKAQSSVTYVNGMGVGDTSIMHVTIAPDFTNIGGRFVFLPLLRSICRCRVVRHIAGRPAEL